jgi:hypothetical protein
MLAPLGRLARRPDPDARPTLDPGCEPTPPQGSHPMAACMELPNGILSPRFAPGAVEWRFKTRYGWKDARIQQCVADGLRLTIPLRVALTNGLGEIKISSGAPQAAELRLRVREKSPTKIRIGNSLRADICCPPPRDEREKKDLHFRHHYSLIKAPKKVEYIPHSTAYPCGKPPDKEKALSPIPIDVDSLGGSDCLGAQWPD